MARVTFKRIDAEEYAIYVDGEPAGALYRDEDEDFATPGGFRRERFYVWDFADFDGHLPEDVANILERDVQQIRGLNAASTWPSASYEAFSRVHLEVMSLLHGDRAGFDSQVPYQFFRS